MKKLLEFTSGAMLILFLFVSIKNCDAQAVQYQWLSSGGGSTTDQGNCVYNSSGNIWKGGQVSSGAVFKRPDGTTLSLSNAGAYVAYYSNAKTISSVTYYGYANWISNVQLTSGNFLPASSAVKAISRYSNTLFVTGVYNTGGNNYMFVAKFDASTGAQIFPVYTALSATGNGIAVTSSNVYVTGSYEGLVDFPSSPGGSTAITLTGSTPECYLLKLDQSLNYSLAITAVTTSLKTSTGNGIYLNGTKVYVTGSFGNTTSGTINIAFGSTSTNSNGFNDIFTAQFETSTLVCNWIRNGGATTNSISSNDEGLGITGDASAVYITGRLETNGNFGAGFPLATGGGYMVKYNTSGTVLWAVIAHASALNAISTLNNVVFACGSSVVRVDGATGANNWTLGLGSGGSVGYGISAAEACNVYVTGYSGSNTWLGIPDPVVPSGSNDAFLTSISKSASVTASVTSGTQCGSTAFTLCASPTSSYTWMTNPTQSTQCISPTVCGTQYFNVLGNDGSCTSIATVKVNSKMTITTTGGNCQGQLTPDCILTNLSCTTGTVARQWQYKATIGGTWANASAPSTGTTYHPTALGYYRLQITTPTCTNYSTTHGYDNSCRMSGSVSSEESVLNISLKPNPAQSTLTISIDQDLEGEASVQIIDMSGRLVMRLPQLELQPGTSESDHDISALASGIYYLNVTIGEKQITKKLIKE